MWQCRRREGGSNCHWQLLCKWPFTTLLPPTAPSSAETHSAIAAPFGRASESSDQAVERGASAQGSAAGLAQEIKQGKKSFADLNVEEIGSEIVGTLDAGDVESFSKSIGDVLPMLSRMASGAGVPGVVPGMGDVGSGSNRV